MGGGRWPKEDTKAEGESGGRKWLEIQSGLSREAETVDK